MMLTVRDPWEQRLDWLLTSVLWASLTVSVIVSAMLDGATANVGISALFAAAWVVAMQVFSARGRHNFEQWGELLAVVGVVASLVAMALTGGADSVYVLFLAGPPLFAASFLSSRIAYEIGILSIAGLYVVARALEQPLLDQSTFRSAFLYALIVIAFTQLRRILIETQERSAELQAASARVERIQTAHTLLTSLSELANTQELNPVTIGTVALRDLATSVPFAAGRVTLVRDDGDTVVVATRGTPEEGEPEIYQIEMRGITVGMVELWPAPGADLRAFLPAIQPIVRQLGLAFDNVGIVQRIAHRTVYEERIRLARELHDNIGPGLASLGLRLDMLIYQATDDPDLVRHLEGTRQAVTALVEEVRTTVSDLRHDNVASIVEQAHEIAAAIAGAGPEITIAIREHRPPRPAVAVEIRAILTEAVRNAVEHSGATHLGIEGEVDRDRGHITITDNGRGFDPGDLPEGHYGVMGMQERATEIGARLTIDSSATAGSRVTIAWEAD